MSDVLVIETGSEAFDALLDAISDPFTTRISLDQREDGVAIKVNENVWSIGLATRREVQ